MPQPCLLCHARPGPVCDADRQAIDQQLAGLPARLAKVADVLAPSRAPIGERVAMGAHAHSDAPARMDALSLTGPGGDVPTLHPLINHWSVRRKVQVTTLRDGEARVVEVQVVDWFHEAVRDSAGRPVMVADDDQVGPVPPREWLDMQVRRWRSHFGHHTPARTIGRPARPYVPATFHNLLRSHSRAWELIAMLAAANEIQHPGTRARMYYSGLLTYEQNPGRGELERRGRPPGSMLRDVAYLRTWLPYACEQETLDVRGFAAQLSGLHAEISRVLGDVPDQTWIGRCPAFLHEYDDDGEPTGRKRPCGAGLWQENGAWISAQVVCPRCRTTWETRGHAGAGTAQEIRRVWPVDRRCRYTAEQIDQLPALKCRGCGKRVTVSWREVTGTSDRERTWQPVAGCCPNNCDEARRAI